MAMVADIFDLRLRSEIPGRQRWEIPGLVGRRDLARRLETLMGDVAGVRDVRANHLTGRVLLHFEALTVNGARVIRDALDRLIREAAPGGRPPEGEAVHPALLSADNPLRELLTRFRLDRKGAREAPLWSIVNNVVNFLPELGLVAIVNVVNKDAPKFLAAMGLRSMPAQLVFLGAFTAAAFAAELVVERKKREAWRRMARDLEHRVRVDTYAHVQELDLATIENQSSGALVRTLSEHLSTINRFLETGADDMLQRAITALIIVVTLLAVSPTLAVTALAPLPIIMLGARYVQTKTEKPYEEMAEVNGRLNKLLSNNLADLATIKSFTAERQEVDRLLRISEGVRDTSDRAVATSSKYTDVMRLLISLSFALSMTAGGFLVARNSIAPSMFTLLLFFVPKLLVRMEGMGEGYDMYKNAVGSAAELLKLIRAEPTIVGGDTPLPADRVEGMVCFEGIDFAYRPDNPLFRNFSVTIPPRQTVAFVGSTGAGKSTLVKLMMRFYDVNGGSILLDGQDLRDLDLTDLRRAIGFVSQDVSLFDGSIRDNILYGRPDASFEDVVEAARAAEAHAFIEALPDGYDTAVGERGKKLSGGQRQRISIARTMLKNPPILILDEATSAVDNETEAAIQLSIDRISRDRTTVMIAHRLSTVRNADMIHVLEEGRIVESGSHEKLLRRKGIYAGLWRVQTGEAVRRLHHAST
jgi:ATP-binding cassette subfamily B protein